MSDETTFMAARSSQETEDIHMTVACIRQTTMVMVEWSRFIGTDKTLVTHRLDQEEAEENNWSISNDHSSTIFPVGGGNALAQRMVDGKRLLVRVTPYSETSVTATFLLDGLGQALSKARSCSPDLRLPAN